MFSRKFFLSSISVRNSLFFLPFSYCSFGRNYHNNPITPTNPHSNNYCFLGVGSNVSPRYLSVLSSFDQLLFYGFKILSTGFLYETTHIDENKNKNENEKRN